MKERLKLVLTNRGTTRIIDPGRVLSAVLIPLYIRRGRWYIVFIKRTELVREHKGQISFPGGAFEPADGTLRTTALRESAEEIGLRPEDVEVLGEMDDHLSYASNYIITPFVGLIPYPYSFKIDGTETEALIETPVSWLMNKGHFHQEAESFNGVVVPTFFYHYRGRVIWGATARILKQFLEVFAGSATATSA